MALAWCGGQWVAMLREFHRVRADAQMHGLFTLRESLKAPREARSVDIV